MALQSHIIRKYAYLHHYMKHNKIIYSLLSIASVCAVVGIVFAVTSIKAYAQTVPFQASCYPTPATATVGQPVTWTANVVGGTKTYIFTWSGDEGLLGNGSAQTKVYYTPGNKYASVKVTSGHHDDRVVCSNPVMIRAQTTTTPPPTGGGGNTGGNTGSSTGGSSSNVNNNYNYNYNTGSTGSTNTTPIVYNNVTYPYTYSGSGTNYGSNSNSAAYYDSYYSYYYNRYNSAPYSYSNSYAQPVYTYTQPAPVYTYSQPTYTYSTPTYTYSNSNYYAPLQVSCSANTTSISTGSSVTWYASVSGGTGSYTYTWSGTDSLYGYGQSISYVYNNPGQKVASVTVYSNNQTITANCTNSVSVTSYGYGSYGSYYNPAPVYSSPIVNSNNNGLDVGCYPDPKNVVVNQPVTWNVEVTGGMAPYRYSWTGSSGLTGYESSVIKYYGTTGDKSAVVTVTSADGRTTTRACSATVNVRGVGTGYIPTTPPTTITPPPTQPAATSSVATTTAANQSSFSANSLFSLGNVPWGWIAVLVILVLFFTVLYLLFNREKI